MRLRKKGKIVGEKMFSFSFGGIFMVVANVSMLIRYFTVFCICDNNIVNGK